MEVALSPTLVASKPEGERLESGAKAGDYVVDKFVGAGAMGEVYSARHPVIGKRVAIKVLKRDLAASEEAADRFVREAQAACHVEHPNVVDVFGFGRLDDGRLYLVMDLVDGRPLRKLVGTVTEERALAILAAIAEALDVAHARGVVHRDLKPDNIVMAPGDKPKILDFGLAKLVTSTDAVGTLTARGSWVGTPGYMAPEQWSADGAGPASDRYALGVIAYELLAGKLPFSATSIPGIMEQHFRAPMPPTGTRFDAVLRRALAKDPEARFPTAMAMVDALRAATGRRATRAIVPAIAAAALLGGGVLVVVATRSSGTDDDDPAPPAAMPTTRVLVESEPSGAKIYRDDREIGVTPMQIEPGDVVLRKPGYLEHRASVSKAARITLLSTTLYEGVWRTPAGELRALEHQNDAVVVSKLDSVKGTRTFFRRYEFVEADGPLVAFASSEDVIDPHAPDDPSCHSPAKVEYTFRPEGEVLEQRRQRVAFDFVEGRCVVREIAPGDPQRLVRVDRIHGDPTWIDAPGTGLTEGPPPSKSVVTKPRNQGKPTSNKLSDAVSDKKSSAPPPPQSQIQKK